MSKFPINYVRLHREKASLSKRELADLVGQESATAVTRWENGERLPALGPALALGLVFGLPLRELFAPVYEHVEEAVMRRAKSLYDATDGKVDPGTLAKRSALEAIPKRAVGSGEPL